MPKFRKYYFIVLALGLIGVATYVLANATIASSEKSKSSPSAPLASQPSEQTTIRTGDGSWL